MESLKRKHSKDPSDKATIPRRNKKKIKPLTEASIPKSYLKSAMAYLKHGSKCKHSIAEMNNKRYCWIKFGNPRCKGEVGVPQYNMMFFVRNLRNALLSHDWETALDLLLLSLEKGRKGMSKFFFKSCLPIVFHHPKSTPDFLYNFFETVTGYGEDMDIEKYILLLFRLRSNLPTGFAKRRLKSSKLIVDPQFSLERSVDEECEENSSQTQNNN